MAGSSGRTEAAFGNSERSPFVGQGTELRQLRIFEAVVRHRTVTDAAVGMNAGIPLTNPPTGCPSPQLPPAATIVEELGLW
jgi:hypothetical protein